jgi:Fic family protein
VPTCINQEWITDDPELVNLLVEAQAKLATLNTIGSLMPEIGFLVKMHLAKEATQSSRIEGTQTNLEEAVLDIEKIDIEKRDDWQEVQNYIQAMEFAITGLNTLPLSGRLIKQTHAILLQGVRGKHKSPGQYRQSQNWVGGATLADAVFIPPAPEYLSELLGDLDEFMNNDNLLISPIIRAGIIHYQFETIHPFLDGNGRMGRLLIILYLIANGLLNKSTLYISDYFEKYRSIYFDHLTAVREKDQLNRWLRFFVSGINHTAEKSIQTIQAAIKLKQEIESERLPKLGRRRKPGQQLLNLIFNKPVITVEEVSDKMDIGIATAYRLFTEFEKHGILTNKTGFRRNRIFVFSEYLDLFN